MTQRMSRPPTRSLGVLRGPTGSGKNRSDHRIVREVASETDHAGSPISTALRRPRGRLAGVPKGDAHLTLLCLLVLIITECSFPVCNVPSCFAGRHKLYLPHVFLHA